MRITDKYILFWDGPLSNFHPYNSKAIKIQDVEPLNFFADGFAWKTSEQYFMWRKAMYFNDLHIADEIKRAERPEQAKRLGRMVKNFDEKEWNEVSSQIMFEAVFAKFSQNENLKAYLLSECFDGKHFVEASPFDKIWGIGLHFDNKKCDNPKNWKGENKLGKVLDMVRLKLKENG